MSMLVLCQFARNALIQHPASEFRYFRMASAPRARKVRMMRVLGEAPARSMASSRPNQGMGFAGAWTSHDERGTFSGVRRPALQWVEGGIVGQLAGGLPVTCAMVGVLMAGLLHSQT